MSLNLSKTSTIRIKAGNLSKPGSITLGHSPDPDDAFMFYALAKEKIPTHGFHFSHILQDIQTLNERARRCELDITAISFHAYPYIAQNYALLPCGASMGDGYGPMLISLKQHDLKDLSKLRIAIPGKLTSAFLALKIFLSKSSIHVPELSFTVVPFDQIFHCLNKGQADVGLIIHEGQLTYARDGFKLMLDLGTWWKDKTGLPLPLGGNVILKRFNPEQMKTISSVLSASIKYGLDHLDEAMPHLKPYARNLDDALTRKFVKMYVNDYTVDYGDNGRKAITEFLSEGVKLGMIPPIDRLEFV
jgi:1,4-dihydroxy-6-naphthoate synthase